MKKASATGGTNNKSIDSGYYDVVLKGGHRKTVAYFGKYQQTAQAQPLQNEQFPDKSREPEKTEMSHKNQMSHDMRYRDLETEDDEDQLNGEEEIELEENDEYDPQSYVQQENCVLISDSDEEGNPQESLHHTLSYGKFVITFNLQILPHRTRHSTRMTNTKTRRRTKKSIMALSMLP